MLTAISTIGLAVLLILVGLSEYIVDVFRNRCFRCHGKGFKIVAGERYTREELRTRPELAGTYADILVNGGWAAPAVKETCKKCNGTGKRK